MDVSLRRTRTQRRTVWKVRCGCLEDEVHFPVKPKGRWFWYDEVAVAAHTCTLHPSPRSRMSCRAVYHRISMG